MRCALSGAHLIFLPHKGDTMKKKLLILLLTVVAALCCALCLAGCGGEDSMNVTTESGFTLNFAENSYILKEYSGNDTNVVIPEEYNDIPIISIGYEAFRGCTNLTSVKLKNGQSPKTAAEINVN